jgi:hypothetical protein
MLASARARPDASAGSTAIICGWPATGADVSGVGCCGAGVRAQANATRTAGASRAPERSGEGIEEWDVGMARRGARQTWD